MSRLSIFILLFPFLLSAQDKTVDSLKQAFQNAKHDTTRCTILIAMIEAEGDEMVWPQYNEQLLTLAENGVVKSTTKNLKTCYLKSLAVALNNIGFLADSKGDILKALDYYQRSLKTQEEINDRQGIAVSFNNIGIIYINLGDIPKALDYYHKSLKIREDIIDKMGIAYSLNNIGTIYINQGDSPKALDYFLRSFKIHEEIKDIQGMAGSLNNIGFIYKSQGNISKALESYHKSLKLMKEVKDKKGTAIALNNIGGIYDKQGSEKGLGIERDTFLNKALTYYHKSLKIQEELKNKNGIASSLNNIGRLLFKQGKTAEAFIYAKRSIQVARELGYPERIKIAAGTLKSIYKKQNNFKEAFEMYELEIQMRDSINNTETKKASIKKQFQYEYEKKAAADSVKHAEEQKVKNALLTAQQAQLKQEKTQRIALYGGLVLVIVFSGFVFNRFRVTQKQKIIIEQQKILVDDAFAHLEEKNKEVMDSIHYAKRIQTALLTSEKYIERKLNELN